MYVCVLELCCDVCRCVLELCCDVCRCVLELCCDVCVCTGAVLLNGVTRGFPHLNLYIQVA